MPFWRRKTEVKLIVGLGNPGREHTHNRHNIGFICLNRFARKHGIRWDRRQARARVGSGKVADKEVVLAKPLTFMNRSGESVGQLVKKLRVSLDNLIVVHDDLDLPLGKIRIRPRGSSAGHKGIESIMAHLGSQEFARIRVGIGRPPAREGTRATEAEIIDYVLSDFTPEEQRLMRQVTSQVAEALDCVLSEGLVAAMNRFN